MERERKITSLHSTILDLPPSCIEFCPAHPSYFVVGTYNLQTEASLDGGDRVRDNESPPASETATKPQTRDGSLLLFRLAEGASDVHHIQTLPYPSALLDLHFHPCHQKCEVLAAVSSTGTLSFFRLSAQETPSAQLVHLATHRPLGEDESILFLSCAWHPALPRLLAITTSDYRVHVLQIDESWGSHLTRSEPVITHTLEAWTVAFSPHLDRSPADGHDAKDKTSRQTTIFSGGDDSQFLSTSFCYGPDKSKTAGIDREDLFDVSHPTVSARGHTAGVTAILPISLDLPNGSQVVLTGSYDDCLRVYSFPPRVKGVMPQPPAMLAEENLGGGVWRLKLVKLEQEGNGSTALAQWHWSALILASCMHAGSRVVQVTGDSGGKCHMSVVGLFEEHESMNYGTDFQPGSGVYGRPLRCVSTSFYDKLLCLWEF